MTLQELGVPILFPSFWRTAGLISTQTTAIDGGNAPEFVALVARAPRAGNITHIGYLTGTASGSPAVDVRLESVGSDGLPSGSLFGTNTNASHSPSSNTFAWVALTAAAAVALNDLFAAKIQFSSGTSLQIRQWVNAFVFTGSPYTVQKPAATAAKSTLASIIGVKYDDGTVAYTGFPLISSTTLNENVNSGSTPDEIGMLITLPFACKVSGVMAVLAYSSSTTFTVKVYDGSDNVLGTIANVDSDYVVSSGGAIEVPFSAPIELAAGTYRVTIVPDNATNIQFYRGVVDASAARETWPGGLLVEKTHRTDAGAWTDTSTQVPCMALLVSALDDGAGAGGLPGPVVGLSSPVVRAA